MLFRRQPSRTRAAGTAGPGAPGGHGCPSLGKVVERVLRKDQPRILDLGPMCGETVVYLAGLGARVTVEDFDPPLPPSPVESDAPPPPPPLRIDQPDGSFDLVLVWEQIDFVPPDRLEEFGDELDRVLTDDGWLLALSLSKSAGERDARGRFRAYGDSQIVREPTGETARRRWVHPTRALERALGGFSIKSIHLQRNQIREVLAAKKSARRRRRVPAPTTTRRRAVHRALPVKRRKVAR